MIIMAYNTAESLLDRRKIMESYFPEFLRGSKDYRIFIKLATQELGQISDYIELFTDLANVDKTPEQFIKDLGEMVGYSFIDEVDPDVQREIIKRVFNKHEARGDESSIIKMASHSQNQGYLGGDLFVPGTYLQGQEAVLTFPRDTLFKWNKSKRSGFDKYPDGMVAMDGVIEVLVGYLDDNVKNRVETVKPAGVKLFFRMTLSMTGENAVVSIPVPGVYSEALISISKYVSAHRVSDSKANTWSGISRFNRRSGRVRQEFNIESSIQITVSSISLRGSIRGLYYPERSDGDVISQNLTIPIQVIKQFRGTPSYSGTFKWGDRLSRSGLRVGTIEEFAPYAKSPDLRNTILSFSDMQDVKTDGSNHDRQSAFEVVITRAD